MHKNREQSLFPTFYQMGYIELRLLSKTAGDFTHWALLLAQQKGLGGDIVHNPKPSMTFKMLEVSYKHASEFTTPESHFILNSFTWFLPVLPFSFVAD